jgi:lysophospholipase L1-like esterase
MASSKCGFRAAVGLGLLGMLLGTSGACATDIGVAPDRLLVVDWSPAGGPAKVVFTAKDAAITTGRAADVEGVRVRLHVEYGDGATAGAFTVPPGTTNGWVLNDPEMLRFRNRDAPGGATEVQSIVARPRRLLKLIGAGRGDTPLDVAGAGAPTGSIYVSFEMVEGGMTTRLCSEVQNCEYRVVDGAAGAKLRCLGGVPDPLCRAAYPVYVSGADARYGDAGTLAVIGDSITVQATAALEDALASRWYTHVRAHGGFMFRDLQQAAERIGESRPQVVVIDLGTNDAGCAMRNTLMPSNPCRYPDFTFQDCYDDAHAMVASLSGACIVGTTTWFGLNDLWSEMLATGEVAGVVPWEEYLWSLSAEQRNLLLLDGLGHLTEAGTVVLAQMTAEVVEQACGAP